MSPDAESMNLLRDARAKAGALLEQLLRKHSELNASQPPNLDQDKLAQGQFAMQKAVEAASRTVSSLDEALRIAATSSN